MRCRQLSDQQLERHSPSQLDPRVVERLAYLRDLIGTYTEHVNNMMNYFLVAAGLVLNACVQSFASGLAIDPLARSGLAGVGVLLSLIFLGIHLRSYDLLRDLEAQAALAEPEIFPPGTGVFQEALRRKGMLRMKWLFPTAYTIFAVTFLIIALVAFRPVSLSG